MALSQIGGQVDDTRLNMCARVVPELAVFQTNPLLQTSMQLASRSRHRLAFRFLLVSVLSSLTETVDALGPRTDHYAVIDVVRNDLL